MERDIRHGAASCEVYWTQECFRFFITVEITFFDVMSTWRRSHFSPHVFDHSVVRRDGFWKRFSSNLNVDLSIISSFFSCSNVCSNRFLNNVFLYRSTQEIKTGVVIIKFGLVRSVHRFQKWMRPRVSLMLAFTVRVVFWMVRYEHGTIFSFCFVYYIKRICHYLYAFVRYAYCKHITETKGRYPF